MKKKVFVPVIVTALAMCGFTAFGLTNGFYIKTLANQIDREPYQRSINLVASDFTNGSGSVTKEGNEIYYSGVTINGNVIQLEAGGYLAMDDSGSTTGSGLSGAGFSTISVNTAAAFNGVVILNDVETPIELPAGYNASMPVNSRLLSFEIGSGTLSANSFSVSYECKKNDIVMDGYKNESIWDTSVLSKKVTIATGNYSTDLFAVKTGDGLYIYAEQHLEAKRNIGNDWWQKDNIEFRFNKTWFTEAVDSGKTQFWLSTLNGGSANEIGSGNFGVREDGLNVYYEALYPWDKIGLSYDDEVVIVAGCNYGPNSLWATSEGFGKMFAHPTNIVTNTGLKHFSFEELGGRELLNEPVYGSNDDGWNYRLVNTDISLSSEFIIHAKVHAHGKDNNPENGFVGEFTNGSDYCSWRRDWFSWGSWAGENETRNFNINEISNNGSWDVDGPKFFEATADMDVDLVYKYNPTENKVWVFLCGTSTVSGYEGRRYFMTMRSGTLSGSSMSIGVGYNKGSATVNSFKIVTGAMPI